MSSVTTIGNRSECAEVGDLVPVSVATLSPSEEIPFELFSLSAADSSPVLYRERNSAIVQDDLDQLAQDATVSLHIHASEHGVYRNYLQQTILENPSRSVPERLQVVRDAHEAMFKLAFRDSAPDRLLSLAADHGDELAGLVLSDNVVLSELLPLPTHGFYLYTHASNVSALSMMIAAGLGMKAADGVVALGVAAFLHDLGKRRIAPAMLNQRRPLTSDQKRIVREHPKRGFEEICTRHDLLWDQLMVIYQHHERCNGRGYPVGLVGDEIHLWARICAVADVYDGLTSARPYRPAKSRQEVWEVLEGGAGTEFDGEVVSCLQSVAGEIE